MCLYEIWLTSISFPNETYLIIKGSVYLHTPVSLVSLVSLPTSRHVVSLANSCRPCHSFHSCQGHDWHESGNPDTSDWATRLKRVYAKNALKKGKLFFFLFLDQFSTNRQCQEGKIRWSTFTAYQPISI